MFRPLITPLLGPVYIIPVCREIPVHRDRLVNNLLLFLQLRLYEDRDVPLVDQDPGWSNRDPDQAGQTLHVYTLYSSSKYVSICAILFFTTYLLEVSMTNIVLRKSTPSSHLLFPWWRKNAYNLQHFKCVERRPKPFWRLVLSWE